MYFVSGKLRITCSTSSSVFAITIAQSREKSADNEYELITPRSIHRFTRLRCCGTVIYCPIVTVPSSGRLVLSIPPALMVMECPTAPGAAALEYDT